MSRRDALKTAGVAAGALTTGLTFSTTPDQALAATANGDPPAVMGRRALASNGDDTAVGYPQDPRGHYDPASETTYLTYQGEEGDDAFAVAYDHGARAVTGPVRVGTNHLPDGDNHGVPSLMVDGEGHVHVVFGSHNSPFRHGKSNEPHDITAGFTVGDMHGTLPTSGTYMSLTYHEGRDELYGFYRGPEHVEGSLVRSIDGGESWETWSVIDQRDGPGSHLDVYAADCDVFNGKVHVSWTVAYGMSHDISRRHAFHAYFDPEDDQMYAIDGTPLGETVTWEQVLTRCLAIDTGADLNTLDGWESARTCFHIYHPERDTLYISTKANPDDSLERRYLLASFEEPYTDGRWDRRELARRTVDNPGSGLGGQVDMRLTDQGDLEILGVTPKGGTRFILTEGGIDTRRALFHRRESGIVGTEAIDDGRDEFAYSGMNAGGTTDKQTVYGIGTAFETGETVDDDEAWNVTRGSTLTTRGEWETDTSGGFNGSFLHDGDQNKGEKRAVFEIEAQLATGREMEAYARWPAAPENASNAKIDVYRTDDTSGQPADTVAVDQTANGDQWVRLGTYTFPGTTREDGRPKTGGKLVVRTDDTDGRVVADAVRLVPTVDATPPTTVGNLRVTDHTTTTATLAWDPAEDAHSGLEGYRLHVDGRYHDTTTDTTAEVPINSGGASRVGVLAVDAAGNTSTEPALASVETPEVPLEVGFGEVPDVFVDAYRGGDEALNVEVELANTGERDGRTDVDLFLDGQHRATRRGVLVPEGDTARVSFAEEPLLFEDTIDLEVRIPGGRATDAVPVHGGGDFEVSFGDVPGEVTAGEAVAVEFSVENDADRPATQEVVLETGRGTVWREELTLDAGEAVTESVAYDTAAADVPEVTFTLRSETDEASVEVGVREATAEAGTPAGTTGTGGDGASATAPGFGVGSAATGVLGGLYVLSRRAGDPETSGEED